MRNVIKRVSKSANYISGFVLAILMFLIVADIILRNTLFIFIPGVFELTQILLTMIVFFAVAYAHDNGEHVVIDVIYENMPRLGKWIFSLLSSMLYLGINAVLTWYVMQFGVAQIARGDYTSTLQVPLWPISMLGAVGMLLYCCSVIGDLIYIIKDRGVLTIDAC